MRFVRRSLAFLVVAFLVVLLLLSFFGFLQFGLVPPVNATGANWLTGWSYRRSNVIVHSAGTGTGYQVRVVIVNGTTEQQSTTWETNDTFTINNKCNPTYGDVRFTSDDGSTLLNYWMESSNATCAVFWVQVSADLTSVDQTIYVYYGKTGATTTSSGSNTFPLLFDNFLGTSLSGTWNASSGASVSGGIMTLTSSGNKEYCRTNSTTLFQSGTAFRSNCSQVVTTASSQTDAGYGSDIDKVGGAVEIYDYPAYYLYGYTKNSSGEGGPAGNLGVGNTGYSVESIRWVNSVLVYFQATASSAWTSYNLHIPTTATLPIEFMTNTGASKYVYVDWVLVRKCVDPEPTHGKWGSEETSAGGDTTKPTYSSPATNATIRNTACNFSVTLADETALGGYIFGTNNTGTWANDSLVAISGLSYKANTTYTLNATVGLVIGWEYWFNDSSNNINNTGIQTITTITALALSDLRLSSISDTTNVTAIDVYTWYDWEVNLTDTATLNDVGNVTIRIKENAATSIVSSSPAYNRTGEYWFNYANATATWSWYSGAAWTTSVWLDSANCTTPTKTGTSGYYLFRVMLAKSAVQSAAWAFQACAYDSLGNSVSKNFTAITVNGYCSITILAGNSTHTWANALGGTNDNLIDQGAVYFNVTANFLFKIQAKGDGNLIKGGDSIGLGNVTIHATTLGSSIPLTTSYADVGGLTSQALGEDITLSVKLWLDVPANQPIGDYVYVLTLQATS